jgi:hypothetical protein
VNIALAAGHMYPIQMFKNGAGEFPGYPKDNLGVCDSNFPAHPQEIYQQRFGPLE